MIIGRGVTLVIRAVAIIINSNTTVRLTQIFKLCRHITGSACERLQVLVYECECEYMRVTSANVSEGVDVHPFEHDCK